MDVRLETTKRLKIVDMLREELKEHVEGIILGGSMGFGQNYSIKETSDIDTVVVCERENVDSLLDTKLFKEKADTKILNLFKEGKINFFWITEIINEIEVNFFIYETTSYINFCLLKGNLRGYIHFRPSEKQTGYGFDGSEIEFSRNITEFDNGFMYEKPTLANGRYWGGVPRQDFFYSGFIVFEKNKFLSDLGDQVWRQTIKQLIKEYGKEVDLEKINILNTHYTYQKEKERLPDNVIKSIQKRTKEEFESQL